MLSNPTVPAKKTVYVNRGQMVFRSTHIDELVEEGHPVRAIWELTGGLDLTAYYAALKTTENEPGRPAWDPRMMVSLWILAYTEGVSSAREIAALCEYHPAYQWLTAMEVPNHHSLSDFRVDHKKALDQLFEDVLGILSAEGLVDLETVMQDGTKIQAYASSDTFRREARLREHLDKARQQVASMGDPRTAADVEPRKKKARERAAREKQECLEKALLELEKLRATKPNAAEREAARVSMTDPEARIMKTSAGGFQPAYNAQFSTDAAHQAIVGVGVTQHGVDYHELVEGMETVQENTGELPAKEVVDDGYISRKNIMASDEMGVELYGPAKDYQKETPQVIAQMKRRGVAPAFYPAAFTYDAAADVYRCPAGKCLSATNHTEKGIGVTKHTYRAAATDCLACVHKSNCCPQSADNCRSITRAEEHATVLAFVARMETAAAKALYKTRGAVAEFPNAWIKEKLGLRRYRLRGLYKVTMETVWACVTYNIQLWIRLCWRPRLAIAMSETCRTG